LTLGAYPEYPHLANAGSEAFPARPAASGLALSACHDEEVEQYEACVESSCWCRWPPSRACHPPRNGTARGL